MLRVLRGFVLACAAAAVLVPVQASAQQQLHCIDANDFIVAKDYAIALISYQIEGPNRLSGFLIPIIRPTNPRAKHKVYPLVWVQGQPVVQCKDQIASERYGQITLQISGASEDLAPQLLNLLN